MATYRNFVRDSSSGFDGVTPDAAKYSQSGFLWTTSTATTVGRFAPNALHRQNGAASLVRVGLDVVMPGDLVQTLDEQGNVRLSQPAATIGAFLFLFPRDVVAIAAPAARRANLLVHDLNDEDVVELFVAGGGGTPPAGYGYDHTQAVAASVWVINHGLGFFPVVEVRNTARLVVAVDVTHVDANTCQVGPFFVPTAGTARCV